MKAVTLREHGGPDVLRLDDVPDPSPAPGEVLVRVRASGVEPGLDVRTRQDGAAWALTMPHVLGASSVGVVVDPADPAGGLTAGQRVVVIPLVACLHCEHCRRGQDNVCRNRQYLGVQRQGGYAELLSVPVRNLVPLDDGVSDAAATALPMSTPTAWHMLVRRGRVGADDVVVVLGASGAVGSSAVQIAKLHGARVMAVGRGRDKVARLGELLDPDWLVDLGAEDLVATVERVTGGRGATMVVDSVGRETWQASIAALAPEGRIVCCGASSGGAVTMTLRDLYRANLSILCSTGGTNAEVATVVDLANRGLLTPLVASTFPLEEAALAHEAIGRREHIGKVVIEQAGP